MTVTHQYQQNGLTFRTQAENLEKDGYEWRIELDGTRDQLERIKEIEYILPPNSPNRVRIERDPGNKFAMRSESWGEFDIVAIVHFRNGDEKTVMVPLKVT